MPDYKTLRGAQPAWAWQALDQLAAAIKGGNIDIPRPSADPQKYDVKKLHEY